MEYNSDFRYDLKVGQVAEQALAKIFEGKKVEVKRDRKARLTGNVFVEYESRGKPSGTSTSRLKEIVEPLKGTDKERRGGDNNTSVGVLLRIKDLINTQRK